MTEMTAIEENYGRLVIRFYTPDFMGERKLTQTIDITTHIERAVENVLNRKPALTEAQKALKKDDLVRFKNAPIGESGVVAMILGSQVWVRDGSGNPPIIVDISELELINRP